MNAHSRLSTRALFTRKAGRLRHEDHRLTLQPKVHSLSCLSSRRRISSGAITGGAPRRHAIGQVGSLILMWHNSTLVTINLLIWRWRSFRRCFLLYLFNAINDAGKTRLMQRLVIANLYFQSDLLDEVNIHIRID